MKKRICLAYIVLFPYLIAYVNYDSYRRFLTFFRGTSQTTLSSSYLLYRLSEYILPVFFGVLLLLWIFLILKNNHPLIRIITLCTTVCFLALSLFGFFAINAIYSENSFLFDFIYAYTQADITKIILSVSIGLCVYLFLTRNKQAIVVSTTKNPLPIMKVQEQEAPPVIKQQEIKVVVTSEQLVETTKEQPHHVPPVMINEGEDDAWKPKK